MTSGFGKHVRALRVAAGLTQAQLAERAGISERAVSDIERGLRRGVYAVTAHALGNALDVGAQDRPAFQQAARVQPSPAKASPEPTEDWRALRRTPIVGREGDLQALLAAVTIGNARLVTITGAGGIGKSRLAAEVCACLDAQDAERLRWVSLASLRDPTLLLATVASAVGVTASGDGVLPALARVLSSRPTVLVLDTFEPVLLAAPSIGTLLDHTAGLRVLVTSRGPLRLRGEHEFALTPLLKASAAELFAQRARAARPGLVLTDEAAAEAIDEICVRLSGLPLALELAAAKVRHMSLTALCHELARPLRLLVDGDRDLPERQRTMSATIGWSHDLLSQQERSLFRQLGHFAGGWTLDAAERVCADLSNSPRPAVIADLGRLCEQGLVQTDDTSRAARWYLLDPIRDFAVEKLAVSTKGAWVAQRHAEYYADLADKAAPHLLGHGQARRREQLRADLGNLRVALRWATDEGAADTALRLTGALWMFWRMEGLFDEGRVWIEGALALPGATSSVHRAPALWGAAWLAIGRGDPMAAGGYGEELLSRSALGGSSLDRRNALTILGHVALAERRFDHALPLLEEALAMARSSGVVWHLAASLLNLGTAVLHQGDPRRAEMLLKEAATTYTAAGDQHFLARSLVELGYAALMVEDHEGAGTRFGDALRIFRDHDESWGAAEAVAGFAALAALRGQAETSAMLTGASAAVYDGIGAQVIAPDAELAALLLAGARASLGEARWQDAIGRGRKLTMEESAELAHRVLEPT